MMARKMSNSARIYLVILGFTVLTSAGCNIGQATSPGSTRPLPAQTSFRVVGDVGTPFRALISDSRSSWQIFGAIPTSILIVNDRPPDRVLVTKMSNDARLLSLEVIQGFSIATLDSTVGKFGTAVGATGGKLAAFAPAASPDVRFIVKGPAVGVFIGLVEDETTSVAIESRVPAVILFDSPNGGTSGRVDGIFNQVSFAGFFDIDLTINGALVRRARGGLSVTLKATSPGGRALAAIEGKAGTASRSRI